MNENNEKKNITSKRIRRELSPAALILGLLLSVVMGAANVYLGLRAGMTVAASIPAAVIAMGILHGILRRDCILEANLVQTSASAGESLAAGIIFTMPAMVLAGLWKTFDFWTTTVIAITGGAIGVLFMIPMRRVFVVDNQELKYPEGVACAEVLRVGSGSSDEDENTNSGASLVFTGLVLGAVFKFCASFLGLMRITAEWAFYWSNRVFCFGTDISPTMVGVGIVVGLPVASQIFLGGMMAWLIAIPMLTVDPTAGTALDAAWMLWKTQVRYIGVGAMMLGGVVSIWRVRQGLFSAVTEMKEMMRIRREETPDPKEENLGGGTLFLLSVLCVVATGSVYFHLLHGIWFFTILITILMIVLSFFFTAVASYIVGLVGSSNSPVSGMTISAVMITAGILYIAGYGGPSGMIATLGVAGIICCVACTSGDVCNDLKTGHLIGASPRKQQIMQLLGVAIAAFVMAPIMTVLHEGSINNGYGGIGGRDLPAPQAVLFASLVKGFFGGGHLPWNMVMWGIIIGLILLILDTILERKKSSFRLHLMPVAVGIYLPLGLSVPIFVGGLLHYFLKGRTEGETALCQRRGTLVASGIIAGESLLGVFLGFVAYMNITSYHWGNVFGEIGLDIISLVAFLAVIVWMYRKSVRG